MGPLQFSYIPKREPEGANKNDFIECSEFTKMVIAGCVLFAAVIGILYICWFLWGVVAFMFSSNNTHDHIHDIVVGHRSAIIPTRKMPNIDHMMLILLKALMIYHFMRLKHNNITVDNTLLL